MTLIQGHGISVAIKVEDEDDALIAQMALRIAIKRSLKLSDVKYLEVSK